MIDDEGPDGAVPFARAYDFFKHMTGIALISLGGIFALLDNSATPLHRPRVLVVLIFIGLAGVTSLLMSAFLAGLEVKPVSHAKLVKRVQFGQFVVTMFVSIGLGAFVQTFASAMLK